MAQEDTNNQPLICQNKKVLHDFSVQARLEAGLVLSGTEVKACRQGQAHLRDAYVQIVRDEAVLIGCHIGEYSHGNRFNHEPTRSRKLLLHRQQINKLRVQLREKGLAAVPLRMYFHRGWVKVEIVLGKGKREIDKRRDITKRETEREIARTLRRHNR